MVFQRFNYWNKSKVSYAGGGGGGVYDARTIIQVVKLPRQLVETAVLEMVSETDRLVMERQHCKSWLAVVVVLAVVDEPPAVGQTGGGGNGGCWRSRYQNPKHQDRNIYGWCDR
jgi:hypothetical protein